MFLTRIYFIVSCLIFSSAAFAQISPPGMDDTNAVAWGAVGITQQISKKWLITAYVGAARESDPNNWSLLHKPAIFVLNQETQYLFNDRWQLAICSSFRKQNRYIEEEPFTSSDPSLRNEARYYLRLYYRNTLGKMNITYSFRPELRFFYDTHWNHWSAAPEELRIRFKIQINIPLNAAKTNQFVFANEWLSATDEKRSGEGHLYWSTYNFTEDRFTTYLRHVIKKPSLIVDIGLMQQFKFSKDKNDYIPHLAFDLIFQNPFGKPNKVGSK
jgi:hypothetical protein